MKATVLFLLALSSTGCVTTAWSSTPSPREGWVYVAGSRNADPVVWLCPADGSKECEVVKVEVDE
ncbi:MAG: hypothetical protein JNL21_16540 [Myxococcales bacterium]|jgi:hypothetical protein|nr:hypothetical protein [Myxococcales bacterium]